MQETDWNWPQKEEWKVRAIPSYEQETFDNGMDLFLYKALPIILLFLVIWIIAI